MFKPFVSLLCTAALANVVLAQGVFILSPDSNSTVVADSQVVIQLGKPALSGSVDVAIVIGILACNTTCPPAGDDLGEILAIDLYRPEPHPDALIPYENFTVTIPLTLRGPVQLGVTNFDLLGSDHHGDYRTTNTSLFVIASSL